MVLPRNGPTQEEVHILNRDRTVAELRVVEEAKLLPPAISLLCTDDDESNDLAHHLRLTNDEVDAVNFKILVQCDSGEVGSVSFLIPAKRCLSLLFFRRLFSRLREQQASLVRHEDCPQSPGRPQSMDESEENIAIAVFQRAMGRLFHLVRYPVAFDASKYDHNSNSYVGWFDFTEVWKDYSVTVQLSFAERVYITMDDPQSSVLAKILSVVILTTIVISSLVFILSTVPDLQEDPIGGKPPQPGKVFDVIEYICLAIFVVEYSVRFCACPMVRYEILDPEKILDVASGYEKIHLSRPLQRLKRFVLNPSNIIDLAAILPGVVTVFAFIVTGNPEGNGGGFVVLRLVRLTRIVRAFRIGKYVESVVVIKRTVIQSTKALYVLGGNLFLGVVIFGSLMYLMEQGEWDKSMQSYKRQVSRHWNSTLNEYVEEYAPSPWKSIPYCFWWAMVTAASVGYGDPQSGFPTTPKGYIVASLCMIWSLVILALPVGVIGGTFTQVWHDFAKAKVRDAEILRTEMVYVASAVQRVEPTKVSRLVLLEVWDEDGSDSYSMPTNPESFMGEVKIELELSQHQPVVQELKLKLEPNDQICQRTVTGFIYIRYEWTPSPGPASVSADALHLHGDLRFYVQGGAGLINTDWSHPDGMSSPYVLVVTYPNSPKAGEELKPVVWRSNVARCCLNPGWDCSEAFSYFWKIENCAELSCKKPRMSRMSRKFLPGARKTRADLDDVSSQQSESPTKKRQLSGGTDPINRFAVMAALTQLTADIPRVTDGLEKLQGELQTLTHRVDHLQFSHASMAEASTGGRATTQ